MQRCAWCEIFLNLATELFRFFPRDPRKNSAFVIKDSFMHLIPLPCCVTATLTASKQQLTKTSIALLLSQTLGLTNSVNDV